MTNNFRSRQINEVPIVCPAGIVKIKSDQFIALADNLFIVCQAFCGQFLETADEQEESA